MTNWCCNLCGEPWIGHGTACSNASRPTVGNVVFNPSRNPADLFDGSSLAYKDREIEGLRTEIERLTSALAEKNELIATLERENSGAIKELGTEWRMEQERANFLATQVRDLGAWKDRLQSALAEKEVVIENATAEKAQLRLVIENHVAALTAQGERLKEYEEKLWRARFAMSQANDALESDSNRLARRKAFERIQNEFEGVTSAEYDAALERYDAAAQDQRGGGA